MRILYLSQYFPPEAGATQTRAYEMAFNFVRLGHQVTMLAEIPNHPSGVIPPAYRWKFFERRDLDGIDVIRVWVLPSRKKGFLTRIVFYVSYMITATLAGLFLARGKYDLVYCSSPPLFTGAAGLALSYLKRTPFFFEVRDLWPESAVALGELSNPRYIDWAERLEMACYQRARKIIVVTQGIRNRLLSRSIPEEKLIFIPNGSNLESFQFDQARSLALRQELGWQDCFIAIYAGIFGLAQGLETILKTADILRDASSIRFLLIGEGPVKQDIAALAERMQLSNLRILPEQSRKDMPTYLSAADVALVPLKKLDLFKGALPSKIFDAWACQRPVIISIDGEAREVVGKANGGLFVEPENPRQMAEALQNLASNKMQAIEMGLNGYRYTAEHYSRSALAEQLCHLLTIEIEGLKD